MERLVIQGTEDTPDIILDKDKSYLDFSGKSLPENVNAFYAPVVKWIEDYCAAPNPNTELAIKLTYFNTASSKILLDILMKLAEVRKKGHNLKVKWHYPTNDEDMLEAGKEYSEIVEMEFELIAS